MSAPRLLFAVAAAFFLTAAGVRAQTVEDVLRADGWQGVQAMSGDSIGFFGALMNRADWNNPAPECVRVKDFTERMFREVAWYIGQHSGHWGEYYPEVALSNGDTAQVVAFGRDLWPLPRRHPVRSGDDVHGRAVHVHGVGLGVHGDRERVMRGRGSGPSSGGGSGRRGRGTAMHPGAVGVRTHGGRAGRSEDGMRSGIQRLTQLAAALAAVLFAAAPAGRAGAAGHRFRTGSVPHGGTGPMACVEERSASRPRVSRPVRLRVFGCYWATPLDPGRAGEPTDEDMTADNPRAVQYPPRSRRDPRGGVPRCGNSASRSMASTIRMRCCFGM